MAAELVQDEYLVGGRAHLLSGVEHFAVVAQPVQFDGVIPPFIDQKQIWFDMALAAVCQAADQFVFVKGCRQRQIVFEQVEDRVNQPHSIVIPLPPLVIFSE